MQRKAYVSGTVALFAALLAGCTTGSDGGTTDDSNPGGSGTASPAAQPGRYRTLPEPCSAVGEDFLDALLPGIREIADEEQRAKAYEGEATLAYDNDRKVGCRWKVDSADATDHLFVDFERVVSYDNAVSGDSQAAELFATKEEAADLPEPTTTGSESGTGTGTGSESGTESAPGSPSGTPATSASPPSPASSGDSSSGDDSSPSGDDTSTATADATPTGLQPRLLDGLGDEAFLDDVLSSSGSTAQRRTVTVAFRTSNVIVTVEYTEQPAVAGVVPDSEEMQDKARKLASGLADSLAG